MKRLSKWLPLLVLGVVFLASVWHVAGVRRAEAEPGRVTIRVGHWLLHAGMREAFAEAAEDYMRLHPHVSVEQIPVPIRAWPSWMRTQLIGGTAPDITGMLAVNEELAARYFLPLSDHVAQPNPYNAGTPLEGVPWRDTFVDGMNAVRLVTPTSGELHGVNLQINTRRLYYNRRLLELVTGSAEPPTDYAGLRALGEQVAEYNRQRGARLVPIASCGPYAQFLFESLMPSQTQKLTVRLSPQRNFVVPDTELARLFLADELSFRETPELRSALRLLRDVSALMSIGYDSRARDDALFEFLQQKAVMIYAGSWDYGVFVRDGDFPVGVIPMPLPDEDDPDYGPFVLGRASESASAPEAMLGVVRTSRHPDIALDFLRFLSSRAVARRFSELSLRISSVVGAEPPEAALVLSPWLEGEIGGVMPYFNHFGGGGAHLVFKRNLHLLIGSNGSVDAFAAKLDAELPRALARDTRVHAERVRQDIRRLDALIALSLTHPEGDHEAWSRLLENRHLLQIDYHTYRPPAP